jgi:hypothetical protein
VEFGNKNSLLQIKHVFSPFFYHFPVEKVAIQLELKNANQDEKKNDRRGFVCVDAAATTRSERVSLPHSTFHCLASTLSLRVE